MKSLRYDTVFPRRLVLWLGSNLIQVACLFLVGIMQGEKHYFPFIPRRQLSIIVRQPPESAKRIPMSTQCSSRRDRTHLKCKRAGTFTAISRNLRKRLLPIIDYIQFRLAFRMLPIRSSFWFLEDAQLDIIVCTQPSCGAVESDQHRFVACNHTAQLWRKLLQSWDQFRFSSRPRWTDIACAIVPTLRPAWEDYPYIRPILWLALISETLHFVWTNQNRRLFESEIRNFDSPSTFHDLLHD